MPGRTLDVIEKCDELRGLLGSQDPTAVLEAVRRAQLALEFRATDEMLGLDPVDEGRLEELRAAISKALGVAVTLGSHEAALELARAHLRAGEAAEALAVLEPAARARDAAAAVLAAQIVWRGDFFDRHAEALEWLQAVREPDEGGGVHYLLALFAFHGIGGPEDLVAAGALQELAAARGSADAMFELYVFNAQGIGRPVDEAAAIAWCQRAAEAGSVRAMGNLGGFHATGNGLPQDPARALEWYRRAAEQGHGRSAATLGVMYATGDCVEVDPDAARRWFAAADAAGFDWRDMADAVGLDLDEWEEQ